MLGLKKQINVPPGNNEKFSSSKAPLSVSPGAITAISLYVKAENSFNKSSYSKKAGYAEAVLICKEIIANYSDALSDGHSNTLVDAKLLLGKSLWHLGRDDEALAVLSEAGKISGHPEISFWINVCKKK